MSPARAAAATALLVLSGGAAAAAVCSVPSQYPSIGEALAVLSCDEITLDGAVEENVLVSRSVTLAGGSDATISGRLRVSGQGVVLVFAGLPITIFSASECYPYGLEVTEGARADTANTPVTVHRQAGAPCPLFRDGFESGGTGRWS